MKKPREFYVVIHKRMQTTPCIMQIKSEKAIDRLQLFRDLPDYEIVRLKEITNAKTTKAKNPKRPKAARKVQAVARKRKKEA